MHNSIDAVKSLCICGLWQIEHLYGCIWNGLKEALYLFE